ncbi:MAG: zf-TFIIB domain-containing protein [Chitinophagaceae bacterium]|nr:zf-TFIIB domain-containing protein [Chitinophagaceae bacterium]
MKCPNCEEILVMTERQGVEIDYCPKCRGVWLDKGELDKIIEKSTATDSNQQLKQPLDRNRHDDDDDDDGSLIKTVAMTIKRNIIKEKEVS